MLPWPEMLIRGDLILSYLPCFPFAVMILCTLVVISSGMSLSPLPEPSLRAAEKLLCATFSLPLRPDLQLERLVSLVTRPVCAFVLPSRTIPAVLVSC